MSSAIMRLRSGDLFTKRGSTEERATRVFVAGASGAIGETLIAELLKRGHSVVGMTTSTTRARILEGEGAEAVIVNAFHAPALEAAPRRSKAEVVIDQLTSLPKALTDTPNTPPVTGSC